MRALARPWIQPRRHLARILALACVVAYTVVPVLILSFGLDRLVLRPESSHEPTHETWLHLVRTDDGRSVAIRRYGASTDGKCVIFFPGQHGGIASYERDLLPMLGVQGYSLYTMSYPGQDGATGRALLSKLPDDVDRALRFLTDGNLCTMSGSVFVGRSFGASVAIVEAARLHPKGVLVEGVSPDLASAIRASMRRRVVTWPWQWLPVKMLVPSTGDLGAALERGSVSPMVVFQGTDDTVTPFLDAKALMAHRPGVRFQPVSGGEHEDTFLKAGPAYRAALRELTGP